MKCVHSVRIDKPCPDCEYESAHPEEAVKRLKREAAMRADALRQSESKEQDNAAGQVAGNRNGDSGLTGSAPRPAAPGRSHGSTDKKEPTMTNDDIPGDPFRAIKAAVRKLDAQGHLQHPVIGCDICNYPTHPCAGKGEDMSCAYIAKLEAALKAAQSATPQSDRNKIIEECAESVPHSWLDPVIDASLGRPKQCIGYDGVQVEKYTTAIKERILALAGSATADSTSATKEQG